MMDMTMPEPDDRWLTSVSWVDALGLLADFGRSDGLATEVVARLDRDDAQAYVYRLLCLSTLALRCPDGMSFAAWLATIRLEDLP